MEENQEKCTVDVAEGQEGQIVDGQEKDGGEGSTLQEELSQIRKNSDKMAEEIRQMHKLYHNEFAGRLKTMQGELEEYHERDRGRVFDDILSELARIYCAHEAAMDEIEDEKVKKQVKYLFQDLEELLESQGVSRQKSAVGDKRNVRFCQIVERVTTDDPKLHDTVAKSRSTGFHTEKRPLVKELVDVYFFKEEE